MDNSQVIEPVFRIVAVRPCPQKASFSPSRLLALTKKGSFALLERLGVCALPRVLGAQCLGVEDPAAANSKGVRP